MQATKDAPVPVPPTEAEAVTLALRLLNEGKPEESTVAIERGVTAWPDSVRLRTLHGYVLVGRRDYAGAEAEFRHAVSLPMSPDEAAAAFLGLGGVLEKLARQAEADGWYDKALALDPRLDKTLLDIEQQRLLPQTVYQDDRGGGGK